MGVPKFFRYTSERYPCLNELVKQYQIPDFDNMYLDMNGIIHNCSHPDDSNPHFRITEEQIFADIFHYISILFQIIKPKRLFFMAIDGVAPRAKMNQQRGRRFRSAREAEQLEQKAREKGETLPTESRFDSNCITPGTVFMARLHAQLRYFVKNKITNDPLWAKCRVILSGHETPGEGEHKIMDYIRWARSQPGYDPDTRHCLYGLDADLIMLGMCTHEPHFALLREEVKFGKSTQRATSPEETNFYLLHLSLMRDYLEQEFLPVRDRLPFEWDLEKIVDDWVLMGFLVGNDFIPNLPNMHINNDALPLLYKTYMAVLPTLDGYINEEGTLNLGRFEAFMQELAKIDKEAFQETYADLRYFQEKTGRRPNAAERKEYKPNDDDTFNVNVEDIKSNRDDDLLALISATDNMLLEGIEDDGDEEYEDISDEEANFNNEFILHKKDYYINKLDYSKVTAEVLVSQAECYVRAIQWNLHYYYRGCASWCWFYPHHYAPYISDIKGFNDLKIEFELGDPFKPFEQLLAVLPAASKALLPEPFHALMTDDGSPIFEYYPVEFETDLNGKKNDWEAVVLIPFIEEKKLLSAMEPCYQRLTPEETQRNTHGPMLIYNYTQLSLGEVPSPEYFPPVADCHCSETAVWRQELDVPPERLRRGVLPGAHTRLYFRGFPTMRHLDYKTHIKKNKCRVFDQPSRNDNMIVQLTRTGTEPPLESVARRLLGRVVWVGWPHLTEAKVISVSNEQQRLHFSRPTNDSVNGETEPAEASFTVERNEGNLHKQWICERSTIVDHNLGRMGLDLGDINIIIHAVNLKGHKYMVQSNASLSVERVWCDVPCGYAYQAVLPEVQHMSVAVQRHSTPEEAFPPGAEVFLMTGPYYGSSAQVVSAEGVSRSGRVKVQVTECAEPRPSAAGAAGGSSYRTAHHAAAASGITTQLLSRLTGCIFVVNGKRSNMATESQNKTNIGLNLKFNKKNQEVTGYTRRCPATGTWLYSQRCVELVAEYVRTYPDLVDQLSCSVGNDIFYEEELFPGHVGEGKPQEVSDWLKRQPHASAARRDCGTENLEPEEMLRLAASVDQQLVAAHAQEKKLTLQVKISLLYMPELHEGNIPPDPKADYQLLDRVVCAASNLTVPLGAKGTITAIYRSPPANTVRLSDKLNSEPTYQVLFDQPFPGAMSEELFTVPRFYRLSGCHLLNISYGRKLRERNGHAQHDPYQPQVPSAAAGRPNQLRTNDGHHSAFASYSSPTKDRHTPNNYNHIPSQPSFDTQDQSTELLKSLLKISQPSPGSSTAASNENWRARSSEGSSKANDGPAQRDVRPDMSNPMNPFWMMFGVQNQGSWRSEMGPKGAPGQAGGPGAPPAASWNPSLLHNTTVHNNYKKAPIQPPPLLPFPNFSQPPPFPQPPGAPLLGFQPPGAPPLGFQAPGALPLGPQAPGVPPLGPQAPGAPPLGLQAPRPPPFARGQNNDRPAPFPPHLPTVLAPSWTSADQSLGEQPAQAAERQAPPAPPVPNPFVPLQVVAKHRRVQYTSEPVSKQTERIAAYSVPSNATDSGPPPSTNTIDQTNSQGSESAAAKPKRRHRRSRIGASLPLQ